MATRLTTIHAVAGAGSGAGRGGRIPVLKTYKLFIGGAFPRTEGGRTVAVRDARGRVIARASRATRKDLRDAVRAARVAVPGWSGRTAFNRGQILYRLAEMLELRRDELAREIGRACRMAARAAGTEVARAIDRTVWYAGWADKFTQVHGSVNPVAGSYFDFTVPEPTGVVGVVAPARPTLLGLVSTVLPALLTGNTVVAVAAEDDPLSAVAFAECVATSDMPAGVFNLLTGLRADLLPPLARHMDVNAIAAHGVSAAEAQFLAAEGAASVKRVYADPPAPPAWWFTDAAADPELIARLVEMKTVWHPVGR